MVAHRAQRSPVVVAIKGKGYEAGSAERAPRGQPPQEGRQARGGGHALLARGGIPRRAPDSASAFQRSQARSSGRRKFGAVAGTHCAQL